MSFWIFGFIGIVIIGSLSLYVYKNGLIISDYWEINIYKGDNLLDIQLVKQTSKTSALSGKDVSDVNGLYVADPFSVELNGKFYMFFEVMLDKIYKGVIAYAESIDGIKWEYKKVVLDEAFHLSFPCVYLIDDIIYMIPESQGANSLRLYRANHFPEKWEFVCEIFPGKHADPNMFRHNDKWWILSSNSEAGLSILYSDTILGPWKPHVLNPIKNTGTPFLRAGGFILNDKGMLIRFVQDSSSSYGNGVWAHQITEITETSFKEQTVHEKPFLFATGSGWNKDGMHHIGFVKREAGEDYYCVDGMRFVTKFSLKKGIKHIIYSLLGAKQS